MQETLLLFGIEKANAKETWEACESKVVDIINTNMNQDTDCNMEIERAHRLGKKSQGNKCPIVVTFARYKTKMRIFLEQRSMSGSAIRLAEELSGECHGTKKEATINCGASKQREQTV